jgi:uncharacterized protein (DUF2336 family)
LDYWMTMNDQTSRFSMLANMSNDMSSEDRRELLRKATATIGKNADAGDDPGMARLDDLLANLAADYAVEVRAELAKLIAATPLFGRTAFVFALDDIEVAGPILKHSRALSDATLLQVIAKNSQSHMMAVTMRQEISSAVSHALVEAGDDNVVVSLLSNDKAKIAHDTFEAVATRAQTSTILQAPLIRREDLPAEMLNDLYLEVETELRLEIVARFNSLSSEEVDKAFKRGRNRVTKQNSGIPDDFGAAQARINDLSHRGFLTPPGLATLLREGAKGRTAFNIAFAQLADVEFDLVQRTVRARDMDTVALLCRGAGFDRALYVTIAIALKNTDDRDGPAAEDLGKLYESVPVQAAQRALRFWKVRIAA